MLYRLWNPGPLQYPVRRPIRYTIGDCLQLTITLGAVGLLIRSVYDVSLLSFITASTIFFVMIGVFVERVTGRKI